MSAIDELATELSRLPGIGRKTALRLTYHLLRQPPEQSRRLADALGGLSDRVHRCSVCANLTEGDPCDICGDARRDRALVCVVEEASDIGAIDGVGPEDLNVDRLVERVTPGSVREVIIATNPSLEGEATALYVQRQLATHVPMISRIARGIPVGGDLEYADGVTIAQALSARREM